MALTKEQIEALDYGYLTGADILKYCPLQIIQNQLVIDSNSLENACLDAYSEILSNLGSRYDIEAELEKTGTSRYREMAKIVSLYAIRSFCATLPAIHDNLANNFIWADEQVKAIRQGQKQFINLKSAESVRKSITTTVSTNFSTIG